MGLYQFEGAKQDTDWTWQTFGRELIVSGDLDPIYVMLAEHSTLDYATLQRWCLAYWCYYHAGVASFIAEAGSNLFFDLMWQGIHQKWPRGFERRHWRGKNAAKSLMYLQETNLDPEEIVEHMTAYRDTFDEVRVAVQSYNGFGPWIAWKIADMAERVLYIPVDFSGTTLDIYKDPVQGAAMVVKGDWRELITMDELQAVVDEQIVEFADLLAPPLYDRSINIQEVETVLCKFKAHYKHHYPMGNDTYHIRKALVDWGDLAQELLRWVPEIKQGHKGYEDEH